MLFFENILENQLKLKRQSKNKSYLMRMDYFIPLTPTGKEMWVWYKNFLPPLSGVAVVTEKAVWTTSL